MCFIKLWDENWIKIIFNFWVHRVIILPIGKQLESMTARDFSNKIVIYY
jgi:hypothetical protein